ncbi:MULTISPECIES: capping complex subunit for YIEGIA [Cohnella]|jgi:hypothetical protein|uniref:capping complex subunit for YIEGIA n=1 Tax=Cohnella TaxID=329857 RepID=UPI00037D08BF|nr:MULTISPECIES: hypothetical protein [Cohnella]REK66111.1 MAG: hypothetical protein C6P35_08805 [Cohnella sp.]
MARIAAIVTTRKDEAAGGAPIIHVADRERLKSVSNLLEKALDCAAHQIHEDMIILVDRHQKNR